MKELVILSGKGRYRKDKHHRLSGLSRGAGIAC